MTPDPAGVLDEIACRSALVEAMRALADGGLVHGAVGCGSVRSGRTIWVTPTRVRYAAMSPEDLVEVDVDTGFVRHAPQPPSRELPLHLAVYAARPDAGAVLHTHSPHATAWSCLGEPLAPITENLPYCGLGEVPVVAPAPAGSQRLARTVADAVRTSGAALLARHGVVVAAPTLEAALGAAEAVEQEARIAWLLRLDHTCPPDSASRA